jgi:hypothetical protein
VTRIVVLRPDEPAPLVAQLDLAARRPLPERPTIGLVANGKPLARELLEVLADEIARRRGSAVDIHLISKPSAARPMTDDDAIVLAARSHLVITGLGD